MSTRLICLAQSSERKALLLCTQTRLMRLHKSYHHQFQRLSADDELVRCTLQCCFIYNSEDIRIFNMLIVY